MIVGVHSSSVPEALQSGFGGTAGGIYATLSPSSKPHDVADCEPSKPLVSHLPDCLFATWRENGRQSNYT
jgi:hypothetical protein